jgi:hypothetical protein
MAENRKPLTSRSQKQQPRRRRLRFEPLESRSLLSAVAVATPEAHANVAPVEWSPHQVEVNSPAKFTEDMDGFAQAEWPHPNGPSGSLASSFTAPSTESSDGHAPLESQFFNLTTSSLSPSGYSHALMAESMVTLAQLPLRDLMEFFGGRGAAFNSIFLGSRSAALSPHEDSSGSVGSDFGSSAALPEIRLSVDVVSISQTPSFAWYGGPPSVRTMLTTAQSVAARPASLPAGTDAVRNLAPFLAARSETSAADGGSLPASTAGQSSMPPPANPASGSRPFSLPASGSDPGLGSTIQLVGSLPAGSSAAAEGGYVDIGNAPSASRLAAPAQEMPTGNLDGGNLGDPLALGSQHEEAPYELGGVATDDGRPTNERSDEILQPESAEQDSARSPSAAEGGMVELAAAASQDSQPISTKAPAPEYGNPLPSVKEIELDKGLGIFHAFELATIPTDEGDQSGESSQRASEAGVPPQANVSPTPAGPSALKDSASKNDDLDRRAAIHTSLSSSILLAAMLVPIGSVRRDKRLSDRYRF